MWGDPDANDGTTFTGLGSPPPAGRLEGDVRLLCVQTTWMDDREVRQYGNLSWVLGRCAPHGCSGSAGTTVRPTRKLKTRCDQSGLDRSSLDPGFKYEFQPGHLTVSEMDYCS